MTVSESSVMLFMHDKLGIEGNNMSIKVVYHSSYVMDELVLCLEAM